jgi:hypothetical protein
METRRPRSSDYQYLEMDDRRNFPRGRTLRSNNFPPRQQGTKLGELFSLTLAAYRRCPTPIRSSLSR